MMEFLKAGNLKDLYGIRHGYFTREGDAGPKAFEEYVRLAAMQMGTKPTHMMFCRQVHSPDCVKVIEPWEGAPPEADAMATREKGLALCIKTADCVPVLFADAKTGVIGAAHAGWRGAIGGVIEGTVKMMEGLGAMRSDICAAIGPCIWQSSYEVGPEFPAPFLAENPENEKLFRPSVNPDHYMFDLAGYVHNKLLSLGLRDVDPSPADTYADQARFFSYRRDCQRGVKGAGRLISAIMLIPPNRDKVGISTEEIDAIADEDYWKYERVLGDL